MARERPARAADRKALPRSGHVPLRTCVGCRRVAPAAELLRVTVDDAGRVKVGPGLGGRGAWLCPGSAACLVAALRRRAFDRSLRRTLGPDQLAELRRLLGPGDDPDRGVGEPAFVGPAAVWEDRHVEGDG